MAQTVPASADLGPGNTGLTIGITVLNVDRTTYAAFSASGVSEVISGQGVYAKSGGVECPDAGGHLVWGESGSPLAEVTVEPVVTVGAIVTGVWEEVADDHRTVGTMGQMMHKMRILVRQFFK